MPDDVRARVLAAVIELREAWEAYCAERPAVSATERLDRLYWRGIFRDLWNGVLKP